MTSEICLSCIIRHPEYNKIKIDMAESEEALERVFEFSFQETSQDLSHNGKLAHYGLVLRQDVLAINLSNTRKRLHGYRYYLHVASQIWCKDML